MRVFTLFDSRTAVHGGVGQLTSKTLLHGGFVALARSAHEPAESQCLAALCTDFDRNLIGCPTHTARTHFDGRRDIIKSIMEDLQSGPLSALLTEIEGTVDGSIL